MLRHRVLGILTVANVILLFVNLAQTRATAAHADGTQVLRGRALQIVDSRGQVRAEILVHGPETIGGQTFPETVLFRMADQNKSPKVKLAVSENGSGLGLSDDAEGGVQLHANRNKGNFVKIVSKEGREQTFKP